VTNYKEIQLLEGYNKDYRNGLIKIFIDLQNSIIQKDPKKTEVHESLRKRSVK